MSTRPRPARRRGTIIPFLAVSVVALFAFIALAVDLGLLAVARTEAQNAADTAALTGARTINGKDANNNRTTAESKANQAVRNNVNMNTPYTAANIQEVKAISYEYKSSLGRFGVEEAPTAADRSWGGMRVQVSTSQTAFFAKVLGISSMPTSARAVAVHRPRDVSIVLDFTGSMAFGSQFAHDNGSGSLNPDPRVPKFGHYERYESGYVTNDPNAGNHHPLWQKKGYTTQGSTGGEVYAPNNMTVETAGGKAIVKDFYYKDAGGGYQQAFHRSNVSESGGDPDNYIAPSFSYGGFDPAAPCPAPDTFMTQGSGYSGDLWPRKGGAATGAWATTAADLLGYTTLPSPASGEQAFLSDWGNFCDPTWEKWGYDLNIPTYISSRGATPHKAAQANPSRVDGRFKGYSMGPGYWGKTFFIWPPDPRWDSGADPTNPSASNPVKDAAGKYIADWRLRFFQRRDTGGNFDTQAVDNDTGSSGNQSVNDVLLANGVVSGSNSTGHVLNQTNSTSSVRYQVNYTAVMKWLKSGPQVFPSNLRAGRVLYYSALPDAIPQTGGTDDQIFWRDYIDYVLGCNRYRDNFPKNALYGTEQTGWPDLASTKISQASLVEYDPDQRWTTPLTRVRGVDGNGASDNKHPYLRPDLTTFPLPPTDEPSVTTFDTGRRPYLNYTDNPNRPRLHFWFGPLSMLGFITTHRGNMTPGTARESQCWQLKAGMASAIEDIKNNHPNDLCGLVYFSYTTYGGPNDGTNPVGIKNGIRVPMGTQWARLKNALYYPNSLLDSLTDPNAEFRAYSGGSYQGNGNIPNADGGTDPNTGFANAYNLLSSPTTSNEDRQGRRGAAKIVVFETDGVPNSYRNVTFNAAGYNSYYDIAATGASLGNPSSMTPVPEAMTKAYSVVDQIVAPTTANGHSLPNAPARVYAIGFGDLFSTSAAQQGFARQFLLEVQKRGKTSGSGDTALPAEQIITGNYQTRISNLTTALERIMQSGVQVTLIE